MYRRFSDGLRESFDSQGQKVEYWLPGARGKGVMEASITRVQSFCL